MRSCRDWKSGGGAAALLLLVWLCALAPAGCHDETVLVGSYDSRQGSHPGPASDAGPSTGRADAASSTQEGAAPAIMQDAGGVATSERSTSGSPGPSVETVAVEEGELREFCARRGPPLRVTADASCSAGIGRRLFAQAFCACSDMRISGDEFSLDSFDSETQTASAHESGAAISVNGALQELAATSSILGSLTVAGGGLPRFSGTRLLVAGDVRMAGPLLADAGDIAFMRDLWLGGAVSVSIPVRVSRDMYWASSQDLPALLQVAGRVERRGLATEPPCACGARQLLDIAAITSTFRDHNDNASAKLDPEALNGVLASLPLELPCGRYAVGAINVLGNAVVNVHGRAVLSVSGDFVVSGNLSVNIDPGAELDLFVGGDFRVIVGLSSFGLPDRPSALRLYAAGSQPISMVGLTSFSAQIYAPNAAVELGGLDTYGSLFADRITLVGAQHHHFDRAVLDLGESCEDPAAARCSDSAQCPRGLACVSGRCGACRMDAECAQPLVCTAGVCEPLMLP